jgi:hypothetical protein
VNARTQAIAWRFALGLVLVEIPVLMGYLTAVPRPEWPILLSGLLGGLAGAITKYLEPQIVSIDGQSPTGQPTIVGVSLKDVHPAPVHVDRVEQALPAVEALDAIRATKVDP